MTRETMIIFMEENPNVRITHNLFGTNEYIFQNEDGKVYDENGYIFEDWYSDRCNGIRIRNEENWKDGWEVKCDSETCKLLSMTDSGRKYLFKSLCRTCQYFRSACLYL